MSAYDHGRKPGGSMAADKGDPWVGVHMLTEFVFCPRAGLLAYEQREPEDAEDAAPPQLNYRPDAMYWSISQIKKVLVTQLTFLWASLASTILVVGVAAGAYYETKSSFLTKAILILGGLVVLYYVLRQLFRVASLKLRIRRVEHALAQTPDTQTDKNQQVNWWSLLRAGFESIPCKEALRDEKWRIAGKPWRVLRYGSLRIPVFRLKGATTKLYRQHYARMAAYCHLIEVCEGAESPYGIILMPNSYDGVTVPFSPASGKAFHQGLRLARRIIRDANDNGANPAPPDRQGICEACKLGRPRVYRPGVTETTKFGNTLSIYYFHGVDGRPYHSPCSDRFKWIPPHKRAYEKYPN